MIGITFHTGLPTIARFPAPLKPLYQLPKITIPWLIYLMFNTKSIILSLVVQK